jgi:hypothetical protein
MKKALAIAAITVALGFTSLPAYAQGCQQRSQVLVCARRAAVRLTDGLLP